MDSVANIKVQIDDSVYVDRKFKSTDILNAFEAFNFNLPQGKHNLVVTSVKDSIIEEKEFEIKNTIYIAIIATNNEVNNYKKNEPIFKDSTSLMLQRFNLDSLSVDKNLSIVITDKFIFDK